MPCLNVVGAGTQQPDYVSHSTFGSSWNNSYIAAAETQHDESQIGGSRTNKARFYSLQWHDSADNSWKSTAFAHPTDKAQPVQPHALFELVAADSFRIWDDRYIS